MWFDNKDFTQLLKDRWQTALVIILSVVAFGITWTLMKSFHIIKPMSTVDTVSFNSLLQNLQQLLYDGKRGVGVE